MRPIRSHNRRRLRAAREAKMVGRFWRWLLGARRRLGRTPIVPGSIKAIIAPMLDEAAARTRGDT